MGRVRIIKDFLPPPEVLLRAEVNIKVTLALSQPSLEYFKKVAERTRTPYQRIIRKVLDAYVARHPRP